MSLQPRSILALRSAGIMLPSVPVIGVRVVESMLEDPAPVPVFEVVPLFDMLPRFKVESLLELFWLVLGIMLGVAVDAAAVAGRCASAVCA